MGNWIYLLFTCLLHSYCGVFTQLKVKRRSIIFVFLLDCALKSSIIWYYQCSYISKIIPIFIVVFVNFNFRNIRALLVPYYATFESTIYQSQPTFASSRARSKPPFPFPLECRSCNRITGSLQIAWTNTAVKRVKFAKVERNTSKLRLLLSLSKV